MAINRAPFNALVDDNGTGLTGSVWNKAAVQGVILDPVDAALPSAWTDIPFNVADFWPGATAPGTNRYLLIGPTAMIWQMYLGGSAPPAGGSTALPLRVPAGRSLRSPLGVLSPLAYSADGTGPVSAYLIDGSSTIANVQRAVGGNWQGSTTVFFTAILALQ